MLLGRVSLEPQMSSPTFARLSHLVMMHDIFLFPSHSLFSCALDHRIIIDRLRQWVVLSGSALSWFILYLSNRQLSVMVMSAV